MDMLQRQRGRGPNPSLKRPRTTSIDRRRSRSTSSESHGRNDRHRKSNDRRQSERRKTADRSKAEIIKQHMVLHELQRRFDSSINKMEFNSGRARVSSESEKNAWIYLVVSQCVVLASVATFSDDQSNLLYSFVEQNVTMYWTAMSLCIVQLILSLFGTAYLLRDGSGYNKNNVRSHNMMSLRITLLSVTLQGIINFILVGRTNDFAVTGLAIRNHNMFYGCWVSFFLISYLFGSAVASVLHEKKIESGSDLQLIHQFCRRMTLLWTMHLLSQICVLSSSASIQVSPICGGMLRTVASCQGVTASLILSVFNIPVCVVCLLNIFSVVKMSGLMIVKFYGLSASVSLLIQAITAGLLTSLGGLASNPGNLYVSTWINTLISLIITVRCMDGYRSVISPSTDHLKLDGGDTMEKTIAFPSARPQTAIIRVSSARSSKTSSTAVSEDEEAKTEPPPILALPAPPAYPEPTRKLVPMREPESSRPQRADRPDPVRKHSPSREPEEPKSLTQGQQPTSGRSRISRRTTYESSVHKSIAPQPPPFRTSQLKPPSQKAQAKILHESRRAFMEPVAEEDERRLSSSDPPSSSPGSIQDATYYRSSSENIARNRAAKSLGMSKSSSDSTLSEYKARMKSKTPSATARARNGLKSSVPKAAASRKDSSFSGDDSVYAKPDGMSRSKQLNRKSSLAIPRSDVDYETTGSNLSQKNRNDINGRGPGGSKSSNPSTSNDYSSCSAANVLDDVNRRKLSDAKTFGSKRLTVSKSDLDKFNDILISDDEVQSVLNNNEEATRNNASSSSKLSTSLKNIDDYITPSPGINPDGLRSSLNKALKSNRPNLSQEPNFPDKARSRSVSRSTSSRKFQPLKSKNDHETAVAAALLAAGSMPFSTKKESGNPNMQSNSSSVISHNSDMDSGVETVSSDSGFSSFKKQASTNTFDFDNNASNHHASFAKSLEKSQNAGDFLDFEYRPRASNRNLNEDFSRGQIFSSFFEDRSANITAPMDSVHLTDESFVSEPTIDNSITTTRRAPKHADIDFEVQAALDRASEVQKAKGTEKGKITIKGHGNAKDVDDMVAAALQAASESRGLDYNSKKTEPTLPTDASSRRLKKKSFSSHVSSDKISHRDSRTEDGSFAHC